MKIKPCQERVIVEHLLEVRDEPVRIRGVPVEPASKLIVNPPSCHLVKGQFHHFECRRVFCPKVLTKQELKRHRLRELGLKSESPILVVELLSEFSRRPDHDVVRQRLGARRAPRHLPHVRD